jgi:hypothetical protein
MAGNFLYQQLQVLGVLFFNWSLFCSIPMGLKKTTKFIYYIDNKQTYTLDKFYVNRICTEGISFLHNSNNDIIM